ncbi:MAG TPA: 2-phospho-L-lactate transferase [Candidatus Polarisedimenticolia bacterium]|nr:2-phospho-L-lactate transferase [Candidatus Polarisedimenticolia bacterium]
MEIVALAGGIGAAKLLLGLGRVMDPRDLAVIVNTGDDIVLHGLSISPDLDIVTYTLAGLVNPDTGWGFRDETFRTLDQLAVYGRSNWFHLGDRDLATHIHRTAMLREGKRLTEVADSIRRALGVAARIFPMSDQPVPTMIETDEGRLHFQEYLVQRRAVPEVRAISFDGIEQAHPAPGVLDVLDRASSIVICPSNPLVSIGPILATPGVREALRRRRAHVIAVCPIVGGKSLKGPSDRMLAQLGHDVSALGVARMYHDICGTFVIDPVDGAQRSAIESLGLEVVIHPTVMRTVEDKDLLARKIVQLAARQKAGAVA